MYDNIVVGNPPRSYPFVEGPAQLVRMLKARFPSKEDHTRIDRFAARLAFMMSPSYKESTAMFFRLKARAAHSALDPPWCQHHGCLCCCVRSA